MCCREFRSVAKSLTDFGDVLLGAKQRISIVRSDKGGGVVSAVISCN